MKRRGHRPGPIPNTVLLPAATCVRPLNETSGQAVFRVGALNLTRLEWTVHRGSSSVPSLAKAAFPLHQSTLTRLLSGYKHTACQNHATDDDGKRPLPRSFPVSEKL